ncbi:MAG TPA: hypothetical protein VGF07_09300 [Stellaceae bacterium]|jgi:hypothetical protein
MTALAIAPADASQTLGHQIVNMAAGWLKRLSAFLPAGWWACPAAWELTGIARIDRFDFAPWLFF